MAPAAGADDLKSGAQPAELQVGLEEIVVTSRRWSERLLDIPDSITAFSADAIERAGIGNIQQVANLTSNFTLASDQNPGTITMTLRGISQVRNGEPPIAFVVDGVTLTSPNAFMQDLFDVERIEVLKGPQGALYGRNSIGGAVNVITRSPTDELDGELRLGFGKGGEHRLAGTVSGPLVPGKVLFRLAGYYHEQDGLITNVFRNEKVDGFEDASVRGTLLFLLSDSLKLDLRASHNELTDAGAAWFAPVSDDNFAGDPGGRPVSDFVGTSRRNTSDFTAKLDWETRYGTLTMIGGYSELFETFREDLDYTSLSALEAEQPLDISAWTGELRFSSPEGQATRWLAGAFYQDTSRDIDTFLGLNLNGPFAFLAGLPPGAGVPDEKLVVMIPLAQQQQDYRSYAFFGQVSHDLLENLELTAALRYDNEHREEFSPAPNPGISSIRTATYSEFQPKVSLSYRLTPDARIYGTVGRGFRPGGFNSTTTFGSAFQPETIVNYEIGFKTRLADRRVTFNGAVFYIDYSDQQFYVLDAGTAAQGVFNGESSEVKGFELELVAQPTERLELSASVGYSDGKLKEFGELPPDVSGFPVPDPSVLNGNTLPYTNRYTVNLAAQYSLPVSSRWNLVARADYVRRGVTYFHLDNVDKQDPYGILDLRLTLQGDKWAVIGYVRNATDEDYAVTYYDEVWTGLFTGTDVFNPSTPRHWGFEARYRF